MVPVVLVDPGVDRHSPLADVLAELERATAGWASFSQGIPAYDIEAEFLNRS